MSSQIFNPLTFQCSHTEVDGCGHCYQCGLFIPGSSECLKMDGEGGRNYSRLTSSANYDSIHNLKSVPEEVRDLALQILQNYGKGSSREGIHRQEMFVAVYSAFTEKLAEGNKYKIPFDPYEISNELKLSQREYNSAMRSLSGTAKEEKSLKICRDMDTKNMIFSPKYYLQEICERNNLQNFQEEILYLTDRILKLDKFQFLLNRKPKRVALAIVKMFILSNRNVSYPYRFNEINEVADNLLKNEMNEIRDIISKYSDDEDLTKYLLR